MIASRRSYRASRKQSAGAAIPECYLCKLPPRVRGEVAERLGSFVNKSALLREAVNTREMKKAAALAKRPDLFLQALVRTDEEWNWTQKTAARIPDLLKQEKVLRRTDPGGQRYCDVRRELRFAGYDVARLDGLLQGIGSARGRSTDVVKANLLRRLLALEFERKRDRSASGLVGFRLFFGPISREDFTRLLFDRRDKDARARRLVYGGSIHNVVVYETVFRPKPN